MPSIKFTEVSTPINFQLTHEIEQNDIGDIKTTLSCIYSCQESPKMLVFTSKNKTHYIPADLIRASIVTVVE